MRNHICLFLFLYKGGVYMERVISPEERIRRAEEIYYRKQVQGLRVSSSSVNTGGSKNSIGKKMIIQIIVCLVIYSIFYVLNTNKNVFGDNVINQTKSILSYDINFFNLYNQGKEYFESQYNNILKKNTNPSGDENIQNSNEIDETNSEIESQEINEEVNTEDNLQNTENVETNTDQGIRWRK